MTEDLHYRRKAQNQKYELARLNKKCAQQQKYIEQLTIIAESYHEATRIAMEVYRKQAVKEFAEILKEFMHTKFKDLDAHEFEYVTENDIDNLVAEMVGEQE